MFERNTILNVTCENLLLSTKYLKIIEFVFKYIVNKQITVVYFCGVLLNSIYFKLLFFFLLFFIII